MRNTAVIGEAQIKVSAQANAEVSKVNTQQLVDGVEQNGGELFFIFLKGLTTIHIIVNWKNGSFYYHNQSTVSS